MDYDKLFGQALVDYTLGSSTTFLEAGDKEEKKLIALVEKKGIEYPNRSLAFFKTIYAECDVPNRNKIRVKKEVAKRGQKSFAGNQINFDHLGAHHICGFILDGEIEDNFMVVYGCLFKEAFKEDFEKVKKLFSDKKLFVSFELFRYTATGEDVLVRVGDGTYEVTEMTCSGCGLLLTERPACPKARVLNLLASQAEIDKDKKLNIATFVEDLNPEIIYAEQYMDNLKCKKCAVCTCEEGKEKMKFVEFLSKVEASTVNEVTEESLKLVEGTDEEMKFAKEFIGAKIEDVKTSIIAWNLKNTSTPAVPAVENKETKPTEEPIKADIINCPCDKEKPVKVVTYYISQNIETVGEDGALDSQYKAECKTVKTFKDGHEEVEESESNSTNESKMLKYTQVQLDAMVKAEIEKNKPIEAKTETNEKVIEAAKAGTSKSTLTTVYDYTETLVRNIGDKDYSAVETTKGKIVSTTENEFGKSVTVQVLDGKRLYTSEQYEQAVSASTIKDKEVEKLNKELASSKQEIETLKAKEVKPSKMIVSTENSDGEEQESEPKSFLDKVVASTLEEKRKSLDKK
jgi:hypothetical protein